MSLDWKVGGNNLVPKDKPTSVVFGPQEGTGRDKNPVLPVLVYQVAQRRHLLGTDGIAACQRQSPAPARLPKAVLLHF